MVNDEHAKQNAKCGYESIAAMVAAVDCNYDRLEELRAERKETSDDFELTKWDIINSEELNDLIAAAGESTSAEDARDRIQEDALSVELRTGWYTPGEVPTAEEFNILLTTGGPALRIRGELDEHKEPTRAWLEYQDWGTPWTHYLDAEQETLLTYCRQFYFGE